MTYSFGWGIPKNSILRQGTLIVGVPKRDDADPMAKKVPTEEARLRQEMRQRGKELGAITKRAKQLLKKLKVGEIAIEERAELDRLMMHDLEEKRSQAFESMTKLMKAQTKK